ncbi:MAG: ammonium transporter [Terriglobales bacterium]
MNLAFIAAGAPAVAISGADNAWLLTCTALVLLMTGPGLALFYGGLVRRKNVVSILMQSVSLMALISVLWAIVGYSLCFAHGGSFLGGLQFLGLQGVGAAPNPAYAPTVPQSSFALFQMMFAIITPALITGAFAERMKFSSMMLFLGAWSLVVYAPMAHMVWGQGGLFNAVTGRIPVLDFAGGTVVHITSGVSALVCALYLGRRLGYSEEGMPPHNLVLSVTGACLLWVGWFGFNAGSALTSGALASTAFLNTQLAAAAGVLSWSAIEWARVGRPTALGAISGAVAGLVAITPACGYVTPMAALAIGVAAGLVCYGMVTGVKRWFGYDDALDAFGVHGAGGTLGAILTGVFATVAVNPVFGAAHAVGAVDGRWTQVTHQLAASGVAWALAGVGTWGLLWAVDRLVGLRVSPDHEAQGLDLALHGEHGYHPAPDGSLGWGELDTEEAAS